MGKIKNNVITKGFSGKFGDDLVFRQVDNKTYFVKRTLVSAAPSEDQQIVRDRFTEAANYASAAIENQEVNTEYKLMAKLQGLKSGYLAAIKDFLTMPEVAGVFTASYKGQVGDVLNIKPKISHKIIDMDVSILDANDVVIESGKAVPTPLKWKYIATVANANVKGSKLVITSRDRQGKESIFGLVL